jgi:hypothetical protein
LEIEEGELLASGGMEGETGFDFEGDGVEWVFFGFGPVFLCDFI